MKTIKSTTKTIKYKTLKHVFPNGIIYIEERENDKFVSSEFKRPNQDKNQIYKEHQYIYSPKLLKVAKENFWAYVNDDKSLKDSDFINPQIDVNIFNDFKNIVHFGDGIDGMTWRIIDNTPLATPLFQDYGGSFCNDKYDVDKMAKHLKTLSDVYNVNIVDIPWYNNEGHQTRGIEYTYLPTQKVMDRLFKKYKKEEFWSCQIHRVTHFWTPDDPLNLKKKFVLPKDTE